MATYNQMLARLKRARVAHKAAEVAENKAEQDLCAWGRERFLRALGKRGISIKDTLVTLPGEKPSMHRARTPDAAVIVNWVHVEPKTAERGAFGPSTYCSVETWWFNLSVSRLKKSGGFRCEALRLIVYGNTPEIAAKKIVKWGAK